ncbi:MAG: hypothetical protein KIT57_10970 [Blastocatellales bacterium]|nr:hypothetical protein [Blastocatellales bacterium]
MRRWLPGVPITLLGDGAYSVVELGCAARNSSHPERAAATHATLRPPPPALPGQKKRVGRPAEKGARLPKLSAVLVNPQTVWEQVSIAWYDGQRRVLEPASGTACGSALDPNHYQSVGCWSVTHPANWNRELISPPIQLKRRSP